MARTPSAEYLVLDIETVPDAQRWQPPAAEEGQRPSAQFPPTWAHRVVVIGALWLDHGYRLKKFGVLGDPKAGSEDENERALLADFSRLVGKARPILVTYNGRGFDLPVIARRQLAGRFVCQPRTRISVSREQLAVALTLADQAASALLLADVA